MRECTNLRETPIEESVQESVQESVVYIRQMTSVPAVRLLGVFGNGRLAHQTWVYFSLQQQHRARDLHLIDQAVFW